jgi:hypothetical protein
MVLCQEFPGVLITCRATVLLLSLLIAGAAHPDDPIPNKYAGKGKTDAEQQQKNTETDTRGTKDSPAVVEISKVPLIRIEATDKTEKTHDYSSAEWGLVYITGALAVITFFLALYTAMLWSATKKLVVGSERNAKVGLRAYVHVKMAHSYRDKSGNLWAKVRIRNFGKTPAYNVVQWIRIVGVSDGDVPNIRYDADDATTATGIIAPGGSTEFFIQLLDEMTPHKEAELYAGRAKVYVWGEIVYADVFGSTWRTRYRMFLSGEGAAEGLFKTDREGNEAS